MSLFWHSNLISMLVWATNFWLLIFTPMAFLWLWLFSRSQLSEQTLSDVPGVRLIVGLHSCNLTPSDESINRGPVCVRSQKIMHGLKRSWHSCPRRVGASYMNIPSMHIVSYRRKPFGLRTGTQNWFTYLPTKCLKCHMIPPSWRCGALRAAVSKVWAANQTIGGDHCSLACCLGRDG